MPVSGYSQTPLAKKLGYKQGFRIRLVNPPEYYWSLFSDLPDNLEIIAEPELKKDCIHLFIREANQLHEMLHLLKNELQPNGMIWVSWPKKASKVPCDLTENDIRDLALRIGLVDIKVCSIDEIWSGLKLVIPVKDRIRVG